MTPEYTCALWYARFHAASLMLFTDEDEAADYAVEMSQSNDGAPEGVQYADGRTLSLWEWPAYRDAERRYEQAIDDDPEPIADRVSRKVGDPFSNQVVKVPADAPTWLGQPR